MGCCTSKPNSSKAKGKSQLEKTTPALQNILKFYSFGKIIGSGSFGTVKLGYLLNDKSDLPKPYAIKTIQKSQVSSKLFLIQRELDILINLDHPNIIRFYETYEDDRYIHFVMEYCQGGELLERLLKNGIQNLIQNIQGPCNEIQVSQIMSKLFSACAYMHSKGIAHRDFKPENLLLANDQTNSEIKIIDFGLSKKLKQCGIVQARRQSRVGTPLYVAPEVLNGNYSLECDNWSLGCIMYMLLCGETPFYSEDMKDLIHQIQFYPVSFSQEEWSYISKEARDVILGLLQKKPNERLTSAEALNSNWIKKFSQLKITEQEFSSPPLKSASLIMLKNYSNASKMKQETLKIVLNQLKEEDINRLTQKFKEIDQDKNGIITFSELKGMIKKLGFNETDLEIEQMMQRITLKSQQSSDSPELMHIKYSEFLAAMLDEKIYLNKERLWQLFKYYDTENRNYLEVKDLQQTLAREGRVLEENQIKQIIQEIDQNKDGRIDFEDFCQMMHQNIENDVFGNYFQQFYASPTKLAKYPENDEIL